MSNQPERPSRHPRRFEILLVPEHVEDRGNASVADSAVRSAVVEATGEAGVSGYPRYAGHGIVAEIDSATHAVEALLVDGSELDLGLSVVVREVPERP
ncbi:hypothetical protein ACFYZ9_04255 [Streptomyces sp. NPDC001691]|uniref:hypothetical protein n=1 Tax=unclassified Streptomyces TaxID=2593676 RepID=UPI000DEB8ED0|nr:hypothetical protein [Streptomyces sp. SDr-06]RCH64336.1 hypothetical protein DT019_33730 [Streptomyces sp. SDr-06]